MRAFFEDLSFGATMETYFRGAYVYLPMNANRRDVWFRLHYDGATNRTRIYAFKTQAEAKTTPMPTTYIASTAAITPTGLPASWVLTPNVGTTPDMTGLIYAGYLYADPDGNDHDAVWGYTVTPELTFCNDALTLLLTYTGAGQSLEGYTSENVVVGFPTDNDPFPFIALHPRAWIQIPSQLGGSTTTRVYPIDVYIATGNLGDVWTSYAENLRIRAAVESILCDEGRSTFANLFKIEREGASDPDLVDYEDCKWMSVIHLQLEIEAMWRDDRMPRG